MKIGIGVVTGNELAAIGNDLAVALVCHGQGIPASVKSTAGGEGAIGGEVVIKPGYARALRGEDAAIALRHKGAAEVFALSGPDQPSRRFLRRVANDVVVIPIIDAGVGILGVAGDDDGAIAVDHNGSDGRVVVAHWRALVIP